MVALLKNLLMLFGAGICLIALGMIFLGAQTLGEICTYLLGFVWADPLSPDLSSVDSDSELRFYSVFFLVFGCFVLRAGRNFLNSGHHIPLLLAIFFMGGLARLLSWVSVGRPEALFQFLMYLEITVPIMLGVLFWLARGQSAR